MALNVILLALRSVVFGLIPVAIGMLLFVYWLYLGIRSKDQSINLDGSRSSSRSTEDSLLCKYSVCKHNQSKVCMDGLILFFIYKMLIATTIMYLL